MAGILRSAGVVAIFLLAGLENRDETFQELFTKTIAVVAILGAAGLLIVLLLRQPAK